MSHGNRFGVRCGALALACLAFSVLAAAEKDKAKTVVAKEKAKTPTPLQRKAFIRQYLVKKTGKTPTGVGTPGPDPWSWCLEQYLDHEKDPRALQALIGNHLMIADRKFLSSKAVEERRKGLGMAVEACNCATHTLNDKWLATQICEAYVRPNLDAAHEHHWEYLGKQNILEAMADAYAAAEDADHLIDIYRQMVDNAHNRNTADGARMRLAHTLARQEKYDEAIDLLKAIDDKAGVGGAKRAIPDLEAKKKAKEAKEKRP